MSWGRRIELGLLLGPLLLGQGLARTPGVRHHARHASHHVAHRGSPKHVDHRPLIVIDPGHGGDDPGAISVSGTLEKTITLATSLDLRRVLLATGRYRVAMTRTTDRSVSLAARLAFVREHDADMLIAIHADAAHDHHASGASVYVRSGDATTIEASTGLQGSMIEQLADDVDMVSTPARAAHLYVLAERSVPSVLLEMGYLSNRREEKLLRQPHHRHVIVEAIKDAVNDYFTHARHDGGRT